MKGVVYTDEADIDHIPSTGEPPLLVSCGWHMMDENGLMESCINTYTRKTMLKYTQEGTQFGFQEYRVSMTFCHK